MKKYVSIARDTGGAFHHMYSYVKVATGRSHELIGMDDGPGIAVITNREWLYCVLPGSWERQGKRALLHLENKNFYQMVSGRGRKTIVDLLRYIRQFKRVGFSTLSDSKLIVIWQNLWKLWDSMNLYGHVPNMADFEHFTLSKIITNFLAKRVSGVFGLPAVAEIFATLTTPSELTPFQQQDEDFLKLLSWIQEQRKLRAIFRANVPLAQAINYKGFSSRLRRHTQLYDWLQFHYEGPIILDQGYFYSSLVSAERQGNNAQQALAAMKRKRIELEHEKTRLDSVLKLSAKEKYWLQLACDFIYLKGLRKDAVFEASRCLHVFMEAVARRLAITVEQANQIAIPELPKVIRSGRVDVNTLNERMLFSVIRFNGSRASIYIGQTAQRLAKKVQKPKSIKVRALKGMSAYPGKVRGVVRIIVDATDMKKMRKGNILVSPATNPNIMPAIRMAAAIVTDEGGITCHAAIVARELKKPCVIAIKIATQALKDGDRVEVDAVKGIVRKL